VPSKVIMISWMLLLDRIPTCGNLLIHNALPPDGRTSCVLCNNELESSSHLFLHCDVVNEVWRKIGLCLELNFITPNNLFIHLQCWRDVARVNKLKRGYVLIWHAVLWVIWREQNGRIFNNKVKDFDEIVEEIKLVSWHWALSRLKIASCLFYEWFLFWVCFWRPFGVGGCCI
jgi:hypothetical protein